MKKYGTRYHVHTDNFKPFIPHPISQLSQSAIFPLTTFRNLLLSTTNLPLDPECVSPPLISSSPSFRSSSYPFPPSPSSHSAASANGWPSSKTPAATKTTCTSSPLKISSNYPTPSSPTTRTIPTNSATKASSISNTACCASASTMPSSSRIRMFRGRRWG